MSQQFDLIAFDADDTLWHEMRKYEYTEQRFVDLLTPFTSAEKVRSALHALDVNNLKYFGYGVKGFMLSMIEAAISCTEGRVTGKEIQEIVDFGRDMLDEPIELFPHVETTLANLALTHTVMVITKGDLFDQETKVARSGLAKHLDHVEIVSAKTPEVYRGLLEKYNVAPERFLMIGNALRSDVLPVVEIGGHAIHIPAVFDWDHERDDSADFSKFTSLEHIGQVLAFVHQQELTP